MQATALTLLAFATLAYSPGEAALARVTQAIADSLADYDPQALSNSIWALAILGALPSSLWNLLVAGFVAQLGPLDEATGAACLATSVSPVRYSDKGGRGLECVA